MRKQCATEAGDAARPSLNEPTIKNGTIDGSDVQELIELGIKMGNIATELQAGKILEQDSWSRVERMMRLLWTSPIPWMIFLAVDLLLRSVDADHNRFVG